MVAEAEQNLAGVGGDDLTNTKDEGAKWYLPALIFSGLSNDKFWDLKVTVHNRWLLKEEKVS